MDGRDIMHAIVATIIDPIILLLFSVGVFLFMWGLVQFLLNADKPEGKENGQRHMLWGIIGVFIMATVFGIIQIILSTFGLPDPTRL